MRSAVVDMMVDMVMVLGGDTVMDMMVDTVVDVGNVHHRVSSTSQQAVDQREDRFQFSESARCQDETRPQR